MIVHWLKTFTFKLRNSHRTISLLSLGVILLIFSLRGIGLLQPLELAAYDLLFYLSADEPKDSRIVLVTWTEEDIRASEEDIMSDNTLQFMLKTIKQQQPRVIGLDLYRDVPRTSRLLTDEQNDKAYRNLKQIFETTKNLIGVEKIKPPIIASSTILKKNHQIGSSDLITDADNRVRRSFLYPPLKEEDNPLKITNSPYIGVLLAEIYLSQEGWKYRETDDRGSIGFFKGDRLINLQQLKTFDGAYVNNEDGVDFLVNFRRGKTPFEVVTVEQLKAGNLPADLFRDKIVIIGNVAPSIADRHYTPVSRWGIPQEEENWTYGVYIIAHVTSSIVSAALNGRPLLRVFPLGIGYWLAIIASIIVVRTFNRYRKLTIARLLLTVVFLAFILTFSLWVISDLAFAEGWWIPIFPAILVIWGTVLVIGNQIAAKKDRNNQIEIKKLIAKDRNNLAKIKQISKSVLHEAGNDMANIRYMIENINAETQKAIDLARSKYEEDLDLGYEDSESADFGKSNLAIALQSIITSSNQIKKRINQFGKYKARHDIFFRSIGELPKITLELTDINQYIKQIVKEFYQKNWHQKNNFFILEEFYDPELKSEIIDRFCLEIVLSNLLDNAMSAIKDRQQSEDRKGLPTIKVTTHNSFYYFQLIVEDNGVGIPNNLQNEIFEDYVSYGQGSSGIGLSIVKKYLSLEKGRIKVISQVGEGSKFLVSIPKKLEKTPIPK